MLQGQELGLQGLREHPGASEFPCEVSCLGYFYLGVGRSGVGEAKDASGVSPTCKAVSSITQPGPPWDVLELYHAQPLW